MSKTNILGNSHKFKHICSSQKLFIKLKLKIFQYNVSILVFKTTTFCAVSVYNCLLFPVHLLPPSNHFFRQKSYKAIYKNTTINREVDTSCFTFFRFNAI